MKKKKSDWFIVMENENSGLVASMTGLVERKRTELNRELSSYFRKRMPYYKGTYDEEESEEVLDGINSYLDDKKVDLSKLDFPYSSGSEIYLIPIGENIRLKVIVTDEYYGGGDYDKGIDISFFIINENTSTLDVDMLIDFIKQYVDVRSKK